MVGLKVLLAVGLVCVCQCWAQVGIDYLREDSYSIDSDEDAQYLGTKGTNCSCGNANKFRGRIVGGRQAQVNEFPFMVVIVRATDSGGFSAFCGGAVVTEHHVVTAAHCTYGEDRKRLAVVVGEHNLADATESRFTKIYMADKVIEHELYDDDTSQFDIALIVSSRRKIAYNMAVGPICLPKSPFNAAELEGHFVKVMGWGDLQYKGEKAKVLMKVNLRVVDFNTCAQRYSDNSINLKTRHQFCTYSLNKDSCQGDSGGPVVWLDPETNRYTLVGIVSFGRACAGPDPGVNTDVMHFMDWVIHHINADSKLSGANICTKE
uniref:Venom S1 protease 16 n=1 Tax=Lethocerus distinctifemur TaxID=280095 RepID=A0A2K8JU62_9HEMI|nr:venom S1 protease 16 [Lethocerus distinctifemur]